MQLHGKTVVLAVTGSIAQISCSYMEKPWCLP